MCHTCAIQWIDGQGRPTPDNSPAIGFVRLREYFHTLHGRTLKFGDNDKWYPICAAHAAQLSAPDMVNWEFQAIGG
jgi:hypothetical protein